MGEDDLLEEQYGFVPYYESERREGWLLNYGVSTGHDGMVRAKLYLVDEKSRNFLVTIPYYPSFLLKASDYDAVEEYMRRKYSDGVRRMERVGRVDFREYNHLNEPPGVFLLVEFRTETGFNNAVRNVRQVVARNRSRRSEDPDCGDLLEDSKVENAEDSLLAIHEYDIPVEICVANKLDIRCGKWYGFCYDGERYVIERSSRIVFPDLRILAFDIETSKKPLKFPNADSDEIMMISVRTESGGELIVNRKVVSKDIERFEYSPRDDMESVFDVTNEGDEEGVLVRFIEVVQKHRPHLITTFNGAQFDFPFIERRLEKYGVGLRETTGFFCREEYYVSPFIVHLDCYRWVKRDSYLPAGSQGLKSVTRVKLGYFPDEVDPEDMVEMAREDPERMASYSVSDAVATYFLYVKYVQPHVFSICSLIPLAPTSVLCQGSGTLCEALLISEAVNYGVLVPEKRREEGIREYEGHVVESMTYVGGHVECLKAGVFRSDFEYDFRIDGKFVETIAESLDSMLDEYRSEEDFEEVKRSILENLMANRGSLRREGRIYHLDVGAMYPNIILTNKLQPVSIVNEDICIRCDFSDESNRCKKKMEWILKVEYMPARKEEVEMIKKQVWKKVVGGEGSCSGQQEMGVEAWGYSNEVRSRVREYSRRIYRKAKVRKSSVERSTVCQREVPFYVETVRKFRDQRYTYKRLQGEAQKAVEEALTESDRMHAKKSVIVYSSLQVAHKCVLNSFYGYVMRKSSRWYSMEMAAIVCNIGGNIIRRAKEVIEKVGISLELDTDGIWCIVPGSLVCTYGFRSGRKVSLLSQLLNHFVCREFTNDQYQERIGEEYRVRSENSILFEIDGPYRAMVLPASTEESKQLKKRYAIINEDNSVAELKGFEIKRRGELEIIKRLQKELFQHFLDGNNLGECYESLSEVCNYWLDIVRSRGECLDEDTIIELLCESRSMSKELSSYEGKKSNLTTTARRMSEFLGESVLGEKLKCEYIVAAYPENRSVADRTIPVLIFRAGNRERFLERWLGRKYCGDVRGIIDWGYYRSRLECVVQKMVILPALSQGIKNPLRDVKVPSWAARQRSNLGEFEFTRAEDIEDVGGNRMGRRKAGRRGARGLEGLLTGTNDEEKRRMCSGEVPERSGGCEGDRTDGEEMTRLLMTNLVEYIEKRREKWMEEVERLGTKGNVVKVLCDAGGWLDVYYGDRVECVERIPAERTVYMEPNSWGYFEESNGVRKEEMYLPDGSDAVEMATMRLKESDFVSNRSLYKKFFSHFSIRRVFEDRVPALYANMKEGSVEGMRYNIVSSFVLQAGTVYAVGVDEVVFIPGNTGSYELAKHIFKECGRGVIMAMNVEDPNRVELRRILRRFHVLEVSVQVYASLYGYARLCDEQKKVHRKIREEVEMIWEVSRYTGIPVLNVNGELLDMVFYREMKANGVVCDGSEEEGYLGLGDERFKPGLYRRYSIELECVGTLILSIIEYKAVLGETLFEGIRRRDFIVLRGFLKRLVLDSVRGVRGATILLGHVVRWIKRDTKVLSKGLRSVCHLLQWKYITHLARRLKENDYSIISVGRDVLLVDTGKETGESADMYFQHLCRKIQTFPGYEMMKIRLVRKFQRLAFMDPNSYFFGENGEYFSFCRCKVPATFLGSYFGDEDIDHSLVYRVISQAPLDTARTMLEVISLRKDTQALRSNCYRLLRLSEFETRRQNDLALGIVCPRCSTENVLRYMCTKCYTPYPKETVFDTVTGHLKYLLVQELMGDSYCNKCGRISEAKLCSSCRCGGVFEKRRYWGEVEKLRELAQDKVFDDLCSLVSDHFAK